MLAVSTLERQQATAPDSAYPYTLAFDPIPDCLITVYKGKLMVWFDLTQRTVIASLPLGHHGAGAMVVLPHQRSCVGIAGSARAIDLIDLDRRDAIRRLAQFEEGPGCLLPDPASDTLFVACLSQQRDLLYTLDATTGVIRNQAPIGRAAISLAIDPQEHLLYVVNTRAPTLPIINTRTGALLDTLSLPSSPTGLVVDEVGRQVFVATLHAGIVVLRAGDGTLITHLSAEVVYGASRGGRPVLGGIALDATAHRVVLGYDQAQSIEPTCAVTILDSQTHTVVARHDLPGIVMGVRVHGGKHHAYVFWQNGLEEGQERQLNLWVLDSRTGVLLHEEVVARHPLDVLLVESRNQLFIADFDLKTVVCVEDRLP